MLGSSPVQLISVLTKRWFEDGYTFSRATAPVKNYVSRIVIILSKAHQTGIMLAVVRQYSTMVCVSLVPELVQYGNTNFPADLCESGDFKHDYVPHCRILNFIKVLIM